MGGNVFDITKPIHRNRIDSTKTKFFEELSFVFPEAKHHIESMEIVGSANKKDESGDIDLALSESTFDNISDWELDEDYIQTLFEKFKKRSRTATDKQIMKRAIITAIGEKIQTAIVKSECDILSVDLKGSSAGSMFFVFPQYTEQLEKTSEYVQIDVNVGDVDWLKFAYYSDSYDGNVRGLHRTQLMLSLFLIKGYTFSHNYGVKDKSSNEIVAENPHNAIKLLNESYSISVDDDTLQNYFELQKYLRDNLINSELNELYDAYLKILDRTRTDIPDDMQDYWIDNKDRLGLTGKFLPKNSELKEYI